MPKQSALRQFKAALFETLSDPTRIKLLRRLSQSRIEVDNLLQGLGPTERADASRYLAVLEANRIIERFEAGPRIYYSIDSPALREALIATSENPSLAKALSDPLGIEILECLRDGTVEQARLINKIEPDERQRSLDQLESLISGGLIDRSVRAEGVCYDIKEVRIRNLLQLLHGYFDDHLNAALAMFSQVSFAHIEKESARLKKRLRSSSDVSLNKTAAVDP